MNDIMKIVQALEDSNILLKGVTKTIRNETTEQRAAFLIMLLGILGASLLVSFLSGKRIVIAGYVSKQGEGVERGGYVSSIKRKPLIPSHPLKNFEIQKHYENKVRFNAVYSRDLDEYLDVGTLD